MSRVLAAAVLVAAGAALRERALEWWYLRKLGSSDESTRKEGVEGLARNFSASHRFSWRSPGENPARSG